MIYTPSHTTDSVNILDRLWNISICNTSPRPSLVNLSRKCVNLAILSIEILKSYRKLIYSLRLGIESGFSPLNE